MESTIHSQDQSISQVAGFIAKTYQILNNPEFQKIIFWSNNGKEFIIKDISKFQDLVLPKYFRHKNLNSFIRQLNMYGFHKARKQNAKSVFNHPYFLRNRDQLLPFIKRKIKNENFIEQLKTPIKQRKCSDEGELSTRCNKEIQKNCSVKPLQSTQQLIRSKVNVSLDEREEIDLELNIFGYNEQECISIQNQIQKSRKDFNRRLKGISMINTIVFIEESELYLQ